MSAVLYILRHGQTDWNVERRLQGQADTDINALGQRQADANGRRLLQLIPEPETFDFVCSPLRRTRETMERARRNMGLPAEGYRTDPRLMELHFGNWQGFTYAELEAREPGVTAGRTEDKWRFTPPGPEAESYEILARRIDGWLKTISRPTLCVTHGGVIRSILFLRGHLTAEQAAEIDVPQDKILKLEKGGAEWL